MGMAGHYAVPAKQSTGQGKLRRVGFELEFAGLDFKGTVNVLSDVFNVRADSHTSAEASLQHPEWGKFVIEVDSELAKRLAKSRSEGREENKTDDDPLAEWLVNLTTEVVPIEVVCPPVDIDRLSSLDAMVSGLREAGAEGTAEKLVYAFGVHINTELPSLEPATIARYLRAYVIAQDWLVLRHQVNMTRRVTPYIDLYPRSYCLKVLAYDDEVSLETILDDYLEHNATRNRALDMLPLFKHLAEDRVVEVVDDARVKARPTFHYRLPNCEIERGDWGLWQSWRTWCVLEVLADSSDLLDELSGQYNKFDASLINFARAPWHKQLDSILHDLVSA